MQPLTAVAVFDIVDVNLRSRVVVNDREAVIKIDSSRKIPHMVNRAQLVLPAEIDIVGYLLILFFNTGRNTRSISEHERFVVDGLIIQRRHRAKRSIVNNTGATTLPQISKHRDIRRIIDNAAGQCDLGVNVDDKDYNNQTEQYFSLRTGQVDLFEK